MKLKEYLMSLEPVSIRDMENQSGDIYESVVVMSKRAKQVLSDRIVEEIIEASPTGRVYMLFEVLKVKASKNSFHAARKEKSAVTAIAGSDKGSTTLVKTCH